MRPKSLLVLALVVLGLGTFIAFYEQDLPSTDERVELAKKVLHFEDDAVEALRIEWDGREVRFERDKPAATGDSEGGEVALAAGGGWRITSSFAGRADDDAVDRLVQSLTGLESSRTLADFDRGEVGLAEPRARVTLVSAQRQSVLEIGGEVPASSNMVVAVAGREVAYLVASSLFGDLTKEPGDWRDKKLFTGSRADVDRVTLSAGSETVLLAKRGDDFWIESPLTDRADEERVNGLMAALTSLTARAFVDEPLLTPESMGLAPARGVVEVVLAGEEQPFRLELGQPKDDGGEVLYGRAGGQLFELETRLRESLAASPSDWRSRSWTSLQVFKIESARFEDKGRPSVLELSRVGADWLRGEDRIAYSAVSDVLYPITEARGEQVVERATAAARGHDLAQPVLSIALTTKDGEEHLALYPVVDGLAAATAAGRDAVLLVAEEQVTEIHDKLEALRQAEPLPAEDAAAADSPAGAEDGSS